MRFYPHFFFYKSFLKLILTPKPSGKSKISNSPSICFVKFLMMVNPKLLDFSTSKSLGSPLPSSQMVNLHKLFYSLYLT